MQRVCLRPLLLPHSSDAVHPAGKLKARDFVAILPMVDETVVLECTGAQVRQAEEVAGLRGATRG